MTFQRNGEGDFAKTQQGDLAKFHPILNLKTVVSSPNIGGLFHAGATELFQKLLTPQQVETIVCPHIALADNIMFPSPVQPPMLYIKMCHFKFSLRFRVAPLEIRGTTFRKFEKRVFKVCEACIIVQFSMGHLIIKQQSPNSYSIFQVYSKIVFQSVKLTIFD